MCIAAKSFYRLMDYLFWEVVSGLAFIVLWTRYKKVSPTARLRRRSLIGLVDRHVDVPQRSELATTFGFVASKDLFNSGFYVF